MSAEVESSLIVLGPQTSSSIVNGFTVQTMRGKTARVSTRWTAFTTAFKYVIRHQSANLTRDETAARRGGFTLSDDQHNAGSSAPEARMNFYWRIGTSKSYRTRASIEHLLRLLVCDYVVY